MKYTTLLLVGLMVTFFPLTSATAEDADSGTMKEVKNAIAAFKRSNHLCPPTGEYVTLKYETYCKQWCDRGMTCHGSRATDPCAATSNSNECQQFAKGGSSCLNDLNEKNKFLVEYNSIVRLCHSKSSLEKSGHRDHAGEDANQELDRRNALKQSRCIRRARDYKGDLVCTAYADADEKALNEPGCTRWAHDYKGDLVCTLNSITPLVAPRVPLVAPQVVHDQGPSCHEQWLRSCLAGEQESCQPPARWVQAMQNAGEDPYASCCSQAQDTCN